MLVHQRVTHSNRLLFDSFQGAQAQSVPSQGFAAPLQVLLFLFFSSQEPGNFACSKAAYMHFIWRTVFSGLLMVLHAELSANYLIQLYIYIFILKMVGLYNLVLYPTHTKWSSPRCPLAFKQL